MNGIVRSLCKRASGGGVFKFSKSTWKNGRIIYNSGNGFHSATHIGFRSVIRVTPVLGSLKSSRTNNYCSKIIIGEAEGKLAKLLEKSVLTEQAYQQIKTIPSRIDDFQVSLNGAEVTLIKDTTSEKIKVYFNVNHSGLENKLKDEVNLAELSSKPNFCVDITNNENILSLTCSCVSEDEMSEEDDMRDLFMIEEITIYKGKKKKIDYVISAPMISYTLHDLMLDFLDEKGITNEFVYKVCELSASYEHTLYFSLLSELRKFLMHQ